MEIKNLENCILSTVKFLADHFYKNSMLKNLQCKDCYY